MVRLSLGYPEPDDESSMLAGHEGGDRVLELEPVVDHVEVLAAQDAARRVHASKALRDYIVALVRHTRDDPRVELGASPRAGLMLLRAAKAHALLDGRDHALPDDVQALAPAVLVAPDHAGARGGGRRARAGHRRRRRRDAGALGAPAVRSALGCAALGLLLLVVAGTFDAEPLYVTGAALTLLGVVAGAWIALGAWGATITRTIGERSVVEEQPLPVLIEATRGRLPLPPGWIDEPLLPEPVRITAGRSRARVRAEITFGRRGRRVLAPPALVLRDPFGLAQRVVQGAAVDELLVLPRVFPVRATASGGSGVTAHARAALIAAAETEIDGLRAYREGSAASRIHWPSVARGAEMMERKLDLRGRLAPARRAGPARAGVAGRAGRRRPGRRLAHRALRAQDRLRPAAPGRPARQHDRSRSARLAPGARPPRADGRITRARRSPPRRTAAASSSSSPRAWSTGRRAGSAGRRAGA